MPQPNYLAPIRSSTPARTKRLPAIAPTPRNFAIHIGTCVMLQNMAVTLASREGSVARDLLFMASL